MHTLHIQTYSYDEQRSLFPALIEMVSGCGGLVVNRKTVSSSTFEICVEIALHDVLELYSGIVASGLELTRSGHLQLTEMYLYSKHNALVDQSQLVSIYLEISFLEEVTLHALLMTGASLA
ncbi:MAG: hypothetical protein ACYC46_05020 [Acidobacteriaceae bacterium]